jgi:hypothetical protein
MPNRLITRRGLITGAGAALATPSIIRRAAADQTLPMQLLAFSSAPDPNNGPRTLCAVGYPFAVGVSQMNITTNLALTTENRLHYKGGLHDILFTSSAAPQSVAGVFMFKKLVTTPAAEAKAALADANNIVDTCLNGIAALRGRTPGANWAPIGNGLQARMESHNVTSEEYPVVPGNLQILKKAITQAHPQ